MFQKTLKIILTAAITVLVVTNLVTAGIVYFQYQESEKDQDKISDLKSDIKIAQNQNKELEAEIADLKNQLQEQKATNQSNLEQINNFATYGIYTIPNDNFETQELTECNLKIAYQPMVLDHQLEFQSDLQGTIKSYSLKRIPTQKDIENQEDKNLAPALTIKCSTDSSAINGDLFSNRNLSAYEGSQAPVTFGLGLRQKLARIDQASNVKLFETQNKFEGYSNTIKYYFPSENKNVVIEENYFADNDFSQEVVIDFDVVTVDYVIDTLE